MKLFIDTSALYALAARRDQNHEAAKRKYEELVQDNVLFVLSDHVLAETATLLRRRLGYDASQSFLTFMDKAEKTKIYEVIYADAVLLERAKEYFSHMPDSKLSLVDAISFAAMQLHHIRHFFAFDKHFLEAGFQEA